MYLLLRSLRVPSNCALCFRIPGNSIRQHVRWKSKKAENSSTITVRLLKDIPKFGRKGSVMKVAPGRMRYIWFPFKMAEYILPGDLKKISEGDIQIERDTTFRPDLGKPKEKEVELDLLTPQESITILETFLPESLQFARSTIIESGDDSIYGSITTSDIAATIRTMAAAHGSDAARLVINAENIKFTKGDKIQRLGTYTFEIHLKDTTDFVRRKVVVLKQQASMVARTNLERPQSKDT